MENLDFILLAFYFLGWQFIWGLMGLKRYKKKKDRFNYWSGGYLVDKNKTFMQRTIIFLISSVIWSLVIFIIIYSTGYK